MLLSTNTNILPRYHLLHVSRENVIISKPVRLYLGLRAYFGTDLTLCLGLRVRPSFPFLSNYSMAKTWAAA